MFSTILGLEQLDYFRLDALLLLVGNHNVVLYRRQSFRFPLAMINLFLPLSKSQLIQGRGLICMLRCSIWGGLFPK